MSYNETSKTSSSFNRWMKNIQEDIDSGFNLNEYNVEEYESTFNAKKSLNQKALEMNNSKSIEGCSQNIKKDTVSKNCDKSSNKEIN